MHREPSNSTSDIETAAAVWLARRDRGLSPAEQDEFSQWLQADPRHREWFARHGETWSELDQLARWRPAHSAQPNPDLLARPARCPRRLAAVLIPLAAAAAVTLGILVFRSVRAPAVPATPLESAVAHDYDQRVLEDGSVIDLNHGGEIEVRYTATERRVWLTHGEAHFTVAKNAARPFTVRAGKIDIRAVGTAFNVRLESRAVEVLVTEGRVQVTPPVTGQPPLPILVAGQRATVDTSSELFETNVATVSAEDMARAMAWQPRLLEFDSATLADVVAAFNRHNRVQLAIADPQLARVSIGASFRSNNVEGFVRLLESSFGVTAERGPDRIVLRRAR